MAVSDLSRKTDAELARFCSVKSAALARLQNQIDAAPDANPGLHAEFDQTAELLSAAISELQHRFP